MKFKTGDNVIANAVDVYNDKTVILNNVECIITECAIINDVEIYYIEYYYNGDKYNRFYSSSSLKINRKYRIDNLLKDI